MSGRAAQQQAEEAAAEGPTTTPYDTRLHPALAVLLQQGKGKQGKGQGQASAAAAAPVSASGAPLDEGLAELQEEARALMVEMIRNRCVNYGDGRCDERPSIATLAAYLDRYGLPHETHHPPGKPHRPSLISVYDGGLPGPRVMLGPGHVDVVPVSEEDWRYPAFDGEVVDGKVYGRGTVDMLSTVAIHAVVYARIASAKLPLKGTLAFCAVADEEAGGKDGVGFLLTDPKLREVFKADFCMTEFGGATLINRYNQPTRTYIQSNGEKGIATVEVVCKGRSGHGSVPKGCDNALVKAAEAIKLLSSYWTPTVITPEWCSLIDNSDAPWLAGLLLKSPWLCAPTLSLLLAVGHALGSAGHALTRMTISPNHVKGTLKSNVVPGTATVEVDVRVLPGQDEAYVVDQLHRALSRGSLKRSDYDISVTSFFPATTSRVDTPLWAAMKAAATELVPGATFAHPLISGSTDSRYYRRHAGAVAYGTGLYHPSLTFKHMMHCFHGNDEHLSLQSLRMNLQYFGLVVLKAMGAEGKG